MSPTPVAVATALLRHLEEQRLRLSRNCRTRRSRRSRTTGSRRTWRSSGARWPSPSPGARSSRPVARRCDGDEVCDAAFQSRQAARLLSSSPSDTTSMGCCRREIPSSRRRSRGERQEEVVRTQRGGKLVEHDGLDQNAAKRGAFRVQVVRGRRQSRNRETSRHCPGWRRGLTRFRPHEPVGPSCATIRIWQRFWTGTARSFRKSCGRFHGRYVSSPWTGID